MAVIGMVRPLPIGAVLTAPNVALKQVTFSVVPAARSARSFSVVSRRMRSQESSMSDMVWVPADRRTRLVVMVRNTRRRPGPPTRGPCVGYQPDHAPGHRARERPPHPRALGHREQDPPPQGRHLSEDASRARTGNAPRVSLLAEPGYCRSSADRPRRHRRRSPPPRTRRQPTAQRPGHHPIKSSKPPERRAPAPVPRAGQDLRPKPCDPAGPEQRSITRNPYL